MKEHIVARVLDCARYMLRTGATVRGAAARLGVSKTTVHKDMRARLPLIDESLYERVDGVLRVNRQTRHLRGGQATRLKYKGCAANARPP